MTKEDVSNIEKRLSSANIKGREAKKAHVKGIKDAEVDKVIKISNDICPKCGNKLVERNGRYGKFKGCSGYLNCRFIVK
ncbi:DNA topoisomerase 1 [compost metagenome]